MHSVARSACLLLAFALNPDAEDLMPEKWKDIAAEIISTLCFWQRETDSFDSRLL